MSATKKAKAPATRIHIAADSSMVSAVDYNRKGKVMALHFKSGGLYQYRPVKPSEAAAVKHAHDKELSVGKALHATGILRRCEYRQIDPTDIMGLDPEEGWKTPKQKEESRG